MAQSVISFLTNNNFDTSPHTSSTLPEMGWLANDEDNPECNDVIIESLTLDAEVERYALYDMMGRIVAKGSYSADNVYASVSDGVFIMTKHDALGRLISAQQIFIKNGLVLSTHD